MTPIAGPVHPRARQQLVRSPLPLNSVQITGGFWARHQQVNRSVSLRHGFAMLRDHHYFHNLQLAAGAVAGDYRGLLFNDSDLYKWLEAVGWELANGRDVELEAMATEAIGHIAAAQQPDGYLNSYYTTVKAGERWTDLDHGHELYCAGHLIQAGVAWKRTVDDDRLLQIALRFVEHIDRVFGPGKLEGICGHPEIEMALVELHRTTGDPRHLALAEFFIDQRGKKTMRGYGRYGAEYQQDHLPFREARAVTGHAVRQLYLTTGAADLYTETGDPALMAALERLWEDMAYRKLYLTGGVGSRHDGETIGNPYELPADTGYCESCAAIASIFWNWRMLLVTGDARYADLLERTLYNGFLSSPGLDGLGYFYVNPLLVHKHVEQLVGSDAAVRRHNNDGRPAWHTCACCPPNVMRLFSSLQSYFVTATNDAVVLEQYAAGTVQPAPGRRLLVETNYPWDGGVAVTVEATDEQPWTLSLRIPGWCQRYTCEFTASVEAVTSDDGAYLQLTGQWRAGDRVLLDLEMAPRLVEAHPRIDAVRGALAVQRGPLVYCLEPWDQPAGVDLDTVQLVAEQPLTSAWRGELLEGVMVVEGSGLLPDEAGWHETLYRALPEEDLSRSAAERLARLTFIPYYAWANRGVAGMRVWVPRG